MDSPRFSPDDLQAWVTAIGACLAGLMFTLWAAVRTVWPAWRAERKADLELEESSWQAKAERLTVRVVELERERMELLAANDILSKRCLELLLSGSAIITSPPPLPPVAQAKPSPPSLPPPEPSSSSGSE